MPKPRRTTPVPSIILALLSLAGAQTLLAEIVRIPALPSPQFADTEASLAPNIPLWNGTQSGFVLTLSLDATSSNNLEAAFWNGAKCEDGAVVIGWDCGEIFISDGFRRAVADFTLETTRLVLSARSRLSAQGAPLETEITANGSPLVFFDSEGEPVAFAYSTAWDAAKIVSRGAVAKNESVSIGFTSDPTVITVR